MTNETPTISTLKHGQTITIGSVTIDFRAPPSEGPDLRIWKHLTIDDVAGWRARHRSDAPSLERKGHQETNRARGFYGLRYCLLCLLLPLDAEAC
jgi:hypothetical protein